MYGMDSATDNCYPDTTVLVNKFDIRCSQKLTYAEDTIVSVRSVQREENPLCVDYDFAHYKQIHWFLFEDLYEWAGQVRAIDISKKTSKFCLADKIENQAELVFARLRSEDFFRGLKHSDFVDEIVDFYCETNYIHPFREGNGRTQRVFIALRVMMPISLTWTANC